MSPARSDLSSSAHPHARFDASATPDVFDEPALFNGVRRSRIYAFVADMLILTVITVATSILFGILGVLSLGLLWPGFGLIMPFIFFGYFTLTLGGARSATPGMQWQGIEMRTWDGLRPGYVQAFAQTLLFYITATPFLGLLLLVSLFNSRKRCVHDYLSGSVYVRTRNA
ncbi:MAG: RDD family protein [Parvibaculum sp.]